MFFFLFLLLAGFTLHASDKLTLAEKELASNLERCKLELNIMLLEDEFKQNELEYNILLCEHLLHRDLPDACCPKKPTVSDEKTSKAGTPS